MAYWVCSVAEFEILVQRLQWSRKQEHIAGEGGVGGGTSVGGGFGCNQLNFVSRCMYLPPESLAKISNRAKN